MRKFYVLLSIMVLCICGIIGCQTWGRTGYTFEESDVIKITNRTDKFSSIKEIKDRKKIERTIQIIKSVEWSNKISKINNEADYSFWLEHKDGKDRLFNYNIWFDDNRTVIFDKKTGKYGLVPPEYETELRNLLD
ncbi:hypothetical protein AT864_00840 [Anoxybacillus sp. P3H1B]|uniref:hypothetical protein n=1 Tax=Anoxybacillus sp. P3H1B TaxID=1769293 RepID=UPI00079B7EA7|nr:hypothetical protein [Anoxybacillus sp. P3H1B]KXG10249.1 hypothetical protein AT864_00840 [Anoxybacillus sp. P3H1B]